MRNRAAVQPEAGYPGSNPGKPRSRETASLEESGQQDQGTGRHSIPGYPARQQFSESSPRWLQPALHNPESARRSGPPAIRDVVTRGPYTGARLQPISADSAKSTTKVKSGSKMHGCNRHDDSGYLTRPGFRILHHALSSRLGFVKGFWSRLVYGKQNIDACRVPNVYLKQVYVKNILSFKDAEFPLGRYTVIVGPNNSGKTNLLRILEMVAKK